MAIAIDRHGNAKLLRWVEDNIRRENHGRRRQREDFREIRKTMLHGSDMRMRYYVRICTNNQSSHMQFDGKLYGSRRDPPQCVMGCNCCYAQWLFMDEDIISAKKTMGEQ